MRRQSRAIIPLRTSSSGSSSSVFYCPRSRRRGSCGRLVLGFLALMAGHNAFCYEIRKKGDWGGANHRTDQQRLANGDEPSAIKEGAPIAPGMSAPAHFGQSSRPAVRIVQEPIADVILPPVDDGHEGKNDVVQGSSDHCCED